ncbi:unnamed protein product, partial [Ectocarpus sp. 13 AM-2016]
MCLWAPCLPRGLPCPPTVAWSMWVLSYPRTDADDMKLDYHTPVLLPAQSDIEISRCDTAANRHVHALEGPRTGTPNSISPPHTHSTDRILYPSTPNTAVRPNKSDDMSACPTTTFN